MTWLTYGNTLNTYIGDDIPKDYGGKSAPLKEVGLTPKYDDVAKETNGEAAKDDTPAPETANETNSKTTAETKAEVQQDTNNEARETAKEDTTATTTT